MNFSKKTISVFLSLLLVLAVLPVSGVMPRAKAANVLATGYCGFGNNPTDVQWTLTDDRVLTFTGTGVMDGASIQITNSDGTTENRALLAPGTLTMANNAENIIAVKMGYADITALQNAIQTGQASMADYFNTMADLYQKPVDSIVVGEGITGLHYAALAFARVSSISLPSSLTSIDDRAFWETHVDTLTIPANVSSIGTQAFESARIRSLVLDCAALSSVGDGTLAGVRNLKEIVVNNGSLDISDLAVPVMTPNFVFSSDSDYNDYLEFDTVYQMLYQAPYIIDWAQGTAARVQGLMATYGYGQATAEAEDRMNTVPAFLDGFNRTFDTSLPTINAMATYCHDYIYNAIGIDIQQIEDVIEDSHFTVAVNAALLATYGVDVTAATGGYVSDVTCRICDLISTGSAMLPWITVKANCGTTPHAICVAASLPFESLGHNFGAWTETIPATATTAGEEQRTCDCGETETREIPALGEEPSGEQPQTKSPNIFKAVIQFFLNLVNYFRNLFAK